MTRALSSQPARPRIHKRLPAYPRSAAIGALLTACCGGGTPAPQPTAESVPVATVTAVPPPVSTIATDDADPAPVAESAMHFPEDDEPLENIGCRGKCAAPYVLGLTTKDEHQIEARIRYCANAAAKNGDPSAGSVRVIAAISGDGRATNVDVTSSGDVSGAVLDCVRRLVSSAVYSSEQNMERSSDGEGTVP